LFTGHGSRFSGSGALQFADDGRWTIDDAIPGDSSSVVYRPSSNL
jgi:hypothetical protein